MNIIAQTALLERDDLKEFADSVLSAARSEMEKNAGELTESLETMLGQPRSANRVQRLAHQVKLAARMGRELATKEAGSNKIMAAVRPISTKIAFALPKGLGRAGVGALVGGVGGALHSSPGEVQGIAPGHHLRNALVGAAGGAALSQAGKVPGAASKLMGTAGKVENAAAHAAPALAHAPAAVPHIAPNPTAEAMGHVTDPAALAQRDRIRQRANSYEAKGARWARGGAAMDANRNANPTLGGLRGPTNQNLAMAAQDARYANMPPPTVAQRIKAMPYMAQPVDPHAVTSSGMATKLAGAAFMKWAFSMSAQAEPGDPTGAQEPEAEAQSLSAPQRPISQPAAQLYNSLKHLNPRSMRGMQVAQPGT